jgi:uncharacterized protein YdcH (DUF465 family)
MNYTCENCNINFSTKRRLNSHLETEKHKTILNLFEIWKNKHNSELQKKDILYNELLNKNNKLQDKIVILENNNNELKNEIVSLNKISEEYRKIVEKCASKATNVVNNKNTYNNNHLNYISSEPINFKDLKKNLSNIINVNSMLYDDDAFNNHIINNILRDENGKDKVLCTDINRKNFSYKDELSGELISDPELEKLREQLRNGVDIKIVRNELLYKLLEKYRDRTDIDPYEKLCYFLEKLEFGDPFVVQVAKKTYIKSKLPLSIE